MFDLTAEEIAGLNDVVLRELVARLCEAELAERGHSPASVTWGGSQTAADGGLDVRVELTAPALIDGFVPRPFTGFQVKKPDMPRGQILAEMLPNGVVRPSIRALADRGGAYIIVSANGSTADGPLQDRLAAMRSAVSTLPAAAQLHLDFYDRTRLASWTRRHPGVLAWVREQMGRRVQGWSGYGNWSASPEGEGSDYLHDDHVRLLTTSATVAEQPFIQALQQLRAELRRPRKAVRLVGLSGVGKTRLAQALFDERVGEQPLARSLALYANLADSPDPQPIGLASDLIASGRTAIIVVDNCPSDLHGRLSEICRKPESALSVLTIEYDVRDDQPEATEVFRLEPSSVELIAKLIQRRFEHVSQVDTRTIAEASGGNARMAISLAETVGKAESIAGLSNEQLFDRLFRQRKGDDRQLLRAAQACSLVYSFFGEGLSDERAEIPALAALVGQTPAEVFAQVAELQRRGLVQDRGPWRAVLPHAIANRLAGRALSDIPFDLIERHLLSGATDRLARSFSRRLSFLPGHPRALAIAQAWLAPDGLLGDTGRLNELGHAMLENVAPVAPDSTLLALERAAQDESAPRTLAGFTGLLWSLAYDPDLFDRCTRLLAQLAMRDEAYYAKRAHEALISLFSLKLSGTHATIEQRLAVVERLLASDDDRLQTLGRAAFDRILESRDFTSFSNFQFGARSRDFGYLPHTIEDVKHWYRSALTYMERLIRSGGAQGDWAKTLLARNLRSLWRVALLYEELERLVELIAQGKFWRDGWIATRKAVRFGKGRLTDEGLARLQQLESRLRPAMLVDEVRAFVMGQPWGSGDLDLVDSEASSVSDFAAATEKLAVRARELGALVAGDQEILRELAPDLLRRNARGRAFGEGLATGTAKARAAWAMLVDSLSQVPADEQDADVFVGILTVLAATDPQVVHSLLDDALQVPELRRLIPDLHSGLPLDARGLARMREVLEAGHTESYRFRYSVGRHPRNGDGIWVAELCGLLLGRPDGFEVALGIVHMRLHQDGTEQREPESALIECGRQILRAIEFKQDDDHSSYELGVLAKVCLAETGGGSLATELAVRLRTAAQAHAVRGERNDALLQSLLKVQPIAVLDGLFDDSTERLGPVASMFTGYANRSSAADALPADTLLRWCAAEPYRRFSLAATFVTFSNVTAEGTASWSDQAVTLLTNAPVPSLVLGEFAARFEPLVSDGSRAALLERNRSLLSLLPSGLPGDVYAIAHSKSIELAHTIERVRDWETRRDSVRDERFE